MDNHHHCTIVRGVEFFGGNVYPSIRGSNKRLDIVTKTVTKRCSKESTKTSYDLSEYCIENMGIENGSESVAFVESCS